MLNVFKMYQREGLAKKRGIKPIFFAPFTLTPGLVAAQKRGIKPIFCAASVYKTLKMFKRLPAGF